MIHHYPIRVYYEDTDMAGIVYHANYLRYIERARSDWVRGLGLDQNEMREDGVVFVVRRIEADYLSTAQFEDLLEVDTTIHSLSPVRLVMNQLVRRGDTQVFKAQVTAVCMNRAGKPVRLPAKIRSLI